MALDQVLLSPIGICLFYSIIKTMEGATFATVFDYCAWFPVSASNSVRTAVVMTKLHVLHACGSEAHVPSQHDTIAASFESEDLHQDFFAEPHNSLHFSR